MDNARVIWDYLKSKGLNDFAVAGIMGNLFAESALNPRNLQNSYENVLNMNDNAYVAAVDNGTYTNFVRDSAGFGLAQWTYWSRKQNLLNFAKAAGASIGDLQMQLDFFWKEIQGYTGVMSVLRSATSVLEASNAVLLNYERPANQSEGVQRKRAEYGQRYYDQFHTGNEEAKKMGYTNSPLVDCVKYSPNHSGKRTHRIDRITPHCVVGQASAERIGDCFPAGRQASCNYGIGYDGRVCLIVDEANRSWCTSSNANDQRAITIECASDSTHPYAFKDACYQKLVKLCIDICQRNGIKRMVWIDDKNRALNYEPAADEGIFTVHRWYANKSCPGDWMYSRMGQLCDAVNAGLNNGTVPTPATPTIVPYQVKVTAEDGLNCRTTYSTAGDVLTTYPQGTMLTITKEQSGWGYTGLGWVFLTYTERVSTTTETEADFMNDQNKFNEMFANMRKALQDNDAGKWSEAAREWAISTGLIAGNGTTINGEPNCMWADFLTREQLVTVLYRFAQMMGKA